jgi:acyl CoA:acetate/3-ketoacid CoA transferase beta subunit
MPSQFVLEFGVTRSLIERAPGATVEQVLAATECELALAEEVREMAI